MLQGTNRLQRGINYVDDLRKLSGSVDHPLGFFSGGRHSNWIAVIHTSSGHTAPDDDVVTG